MPYSLTEEFVAVYRMHPLMPDDWTSARLADDRPLGELHVRASSPGRAARRCCGKHALPDLLYSFGTMHPGADRACTTSRATCRTFDRPDGKLMDLASTDILRIRELGRAALQRVPPAAAPRSRRDLRRPDRRRASWAAEMRDVYDGDVEQVDLMVGMFAERRPTGFAFSDTAFRIFILMASRRLNSDRFFSQVSSFSKVQSPSCAFSAGV